MGQSYGRSLKTSYPKNLAKQGYSQVYTPTLGKLDLYEHSGTSLIIKTLNIPLSFIGNASRTCSEGCSCSDLSNKLEDGEIEGYLLKPMNCPMHIRIFNSEQRSYRDLPIRLAEFGTVYRWEQSGN